MSDDDMFAGHAQELFEHLLHGLVEPELERRIQAGTIEVGTPIVAMQALYWIDRPTQVRINSEVGGIAQVRATREIVRDQDVTTDDFDLVSRFELLDADRDAAHMTALLHKEGWSLATSFTYNTNRIHDHIDAAAEFVTTADQALADGRLRAFSENAFAAAELLAKAELLLLPDKRLINKMRHGTVRSYFRAWTRLENADAAFSDLLNQLDDLRGTARYLRGPFTLQQQQAEEMSAVLAQFAEHVAAVAPPRSIKDPVVPRALNLIAQQDLRAGQAVPVPKRGGLESLTPTPVTS